MNNLSYGSTEWTGHQAVSRRKGAMPVTRPVLRAPEAQSSSWALESRRNDQPGLKQLRSSLVGARVDLLKTTIFAAALVSMVGVVVHRGHLASADNQFAANAGAALTALEGNLSARGDVLAASARAHTDVLAAAARAKVDSAAAQVGTALRPAAKPAPVAAAAAKVAVREHLPHRAHPAVAAVPKAHFVKVAMQPHRMVEHPIKLAAIQPATAKSAGTPLAGILIFNAVDKASDVLGEESSKAYYSLLDFIQGCTEMASFSTLRTQAQSWMSSAVDKFSSGNIAANDPAGFIANAFGIDTAVTAAAAILFLVVCMAMFAQIRNGLRGVGGGRSGV